MWSLEVLAGAGRTLCSCVWLVPARLTLLCLLSNGWRFCCSSGGAVEERRMWAGTMLTRQQMLLPRPASLSGGKRFLQESGTLKPASTQRVRGHGCLILWGEDLTKVYL